MKAKIVIIALLVTVFGAYATCDRKIIYSISQEKPYQLYKKIIAEHYAVLKEKDISSESFKKKLLDFNDYLDCVSESLGRSDQELLDLKNIRGYLVTIVERIKEEKFDKRLDDALADYRRVTDNLYIRSVYRINKSVPAPEAWKKSIPLKAKDILPDYGLFFKNYKLTKQDFEKYKREFTPSRLFEFLKNQRFIGQHKDQNVVKNKIHAFADTLEKLKYRLKKDKKKAWFFKNELQNQIDLIDEILGGIFKIYPGMITAKMHQKVALSTDRVALVTAAQAVTEHTIATYIKKSVK